MWDAVGDVIVVGVGVVLAKMECGGVRVGDVKGSENVCVTEGVVVAVVDVVVVIVAVGVGAALTVVMVDEEGVGVMVGGTGEMDELVEGDGVFVTGGFGVTDGVELWSKIVVVFPYEMVAVVDGVADAEGAGAASQSVHSNSATLAIIISSVVIVYDAEFRFVNSRIEIPDRGVITHSVYPSCRCTTMARFSTPMTGAIYAHSGS